MNDTTVAFYGHFDRQPEANGWFDGLGPWDPAIRNGKLYGRGASDDGYSVYMMIAAIMALRHHNIDHPRCVGI
ncbi:MAG: M20/M25/M40 family metallo-hydrolase, partial [Burkholderiaceae bacterium]|nr:M20/M25/M40 family metallo-hydrolase [Burkholderiaceae bacterium]